MAAGTVCRQLTDEERLEVYHFLLRRTQNGKLERGAIKDAIMKFGVSRSFIQRIRAKQKACPGGKGIVQALRKKLKGNVGRKKSYGVDTLRERIMDVPVLRRGTIRTASHALGIPKSTFYLAVKRGDIDVHSDEVKSKLRRRVYIAPGERVKDPKGEK